MQRRKPKKIDGIDHWLCPTCGRWLPKKSYYSSKVTWNKITSQCRNCHIRGSVNTRDRENSRRLARESGRRTRAANPEKFRARERIASRKRKKDRRYYARQMVHIALKLGMLTKPKVCSQCQRQIRLTAHHPDYEFPLVVEWVCYECHGNR